MNGCLKDLTGNIQTKRGKYVINVNYHDEDGDRKPRQISTGLTVKGYNKRLVEELKDMALHMLNNENADFEYVKQVVKKQAKSGDVPDFRKPYTKPTPEETATSPRPVTAEAGLVLYGGSVLDVVDKEQENPFIIPERVMEIVQTTPRPGIYPESKMLGDTLPLVTYLRNWIKNEQHQVRHTTYDSYALQMEMRIIPFFSFFGLAMSDLTHHHVKAFYNYILEAPRLDGKPGKVSNTTVHRVHSVFLKAMNQAEEEEFIVKNPVAKVHPPREEPYSPQYYSAQQITIYLQNIAHDIAEDVLAMSFFFGTRRSETLGIKESAIDFDAKIIRINHTVTIASKRCDRSLVDERGLVKADKTKSQKSNRTLPVPDVFLNYLHCLVDRNRDLRKIYGPKWNPDGYLCVTPDGKLVHPNTVTRHYKIVARKAGLPTNRLHDARHSIASLMIQNGVDIYVLKEYLGHADIQTTTRYAHLKSNHLVEPANKVQNLISSGITG